MLVSGDESQLARWRQLKLKTSGQLDAGVRGVNLARLAVDLRRLSAPSLYEDV